jgi:hypothetical protein
MWAGTSTRREVKGDVEAGAEIGDECVCVGVGVGGTKVVVDVDG